MNSLAKELAEKLVAHCFITGVDCLESCCEHDRNSRIASVAALIDSALPKWVEVRKLIIAINKADDYLYCEPGCNAFGLDKNFCSCGRRDKFGELLAAFDEVEMALPAAPSTDSEEQK